MRDRSAMTPGPVHMHAPMLRLFRWFRQPPLGIRGLANYGVSLMTSTSV
jgi:hypothetical protein